MSKHLTGYYGDGITFGMEVEATDVRTAMKKTFYKDFQPYPELPNLVKTLRCINVGDLACVMSECAWLLQSKKMTHVQLEEDGPMLKIVYAS